MHKSAAGYNRIAAVGDLTYERLEFLGDAYLELFASRLIFHHFPTLAAGQQSQVRELLVKNAAIAANPVDWKQQDYGVFINNYPAILGCDVSGTVEAIGSGVTHYKQGDRVSSFPDFLVTQDNRNGGFQSYSCVKAHASVKLPSSIDFPEGATIALSAGTAAVGLFVTLGLPRPTSSASVVKPGQAILVWGGSGSVGTSVVQIAKALGLTVLSVNSPRNDAMVKSLGATACFDYRAPDLKEKFLATLKEHKLTLPYGYDSISDNGTQAQIADLVSAAGDGGKIATLLAYEYPQGKSKPNNVELLDLFAGRVSIDQQEMSNWFYNTWLEKELAEGRWKTAPPVEKRVGGIEVLQKVVEENKKGVSGKKLVVVV